MTSPPTARLLSNLGKVPPTLFLILNCFCVKTIVLGFIISNSGEPSLWLPGLCYLSFKESGSETPSVGELFIHLAFVEMGKLGNRLHIWIIWHMAWRQEYGITLHISFHFQVAFLLHLAMWYVQDIESIKTSCNIDYIYIYIDLELQWPFFFDWDFALCSGVWLDNKIEPSKWTYQD